MITVTENQANAFQWLDNKTGARTVRIFEAAQQICPLLDSVVLLIPYNQNDAHQEPSMYFDDETERARVILPPDISFYEKYFSGIMQYRFNNVRRMLNRPNYGFNGVELLELNTAHELGHAARFLTAHRDGGPKAVNAMHAQIEEDYSNLPLGTATSQAVAFWAEDTRGYRTYLMGEGVTEAIFQEMLAENLEAYSLLPEEAAADEFAAKVISRAYAE